MRVVDAVSLDEAPQGEGRHAERGGEHEQPDADARFHFRSRARF